MVFAGAYGLCALAVMIGLSRGTANGPPGEGTGPTGCRPGPPTRRLMAAEQVRKEPGAPLGPALWSPAVAVAVIFWLGARSPAAIALLWIAALGLLAWAMLARRQPRAHLWDRSMLHLAEAGPWYSRLGLWWLLLAAILAALYVVFW